MLSEKYCNHYKTMKTYSLSCKKHTDNFGLKKVIMTDKTVRQAWKCANCVAKKSRFSKQKSKTKWLGKKSILNFSYIKHKSL